MEDKLNLIDIRAQKLVDCINKELDLDDYKFLKNDVYIAVILNVCDHYEWWVMERTFKYYMENDAYNCAAAKENLLIIRQTMQNKIDHIDEILGK